MMKIVRFIVKNYRYFFRYTILWIAYAICNTSIFICIMTMVPNFMIFLSLPCLLHALLRIHKISPRNLWLCIHYALFLFFFMPYIVFYSFLCLIFMPYSCLIFNFYALFLYFYCGWDFRIAFTSISFFY